MKFWKRFEFKIDTDGWVIPIIIGVDLSSNDIIIGLLCFYIIIDFCKYERNKKVA